MVKTWLIHGINRLKPHDLSNQGDTIRITNRNEEMPCGGSRESFVWPEKWWKNTTWSMKSNKNLWQESATSGSNLPLVQSNFPKRFWFSLKLKDWTIHVYPHFLCASNRSLGTMMFTMEVSGMPTSEWEPVKPSEFVAVFLILHYICIYIHDIYIYMIYIYIYDINLYMHISYII